MNNPTKRTVVVIATLILSFMGQLNAADLNLTSHTGLPVYGNTTTGTLTAGGSFTVPSGNSVEFLAANLIRLTPGFTAAQGSYFNAKIVKPILSGIAITRVQNPPFYSGTLIDFNPQGYDQTGQPMNVAVTWSIDSGGGLINASTGVYTPSSQGSKTIRVTSGSIYNTTTVFIESPTAPKASFTVTNSTYPLGFTFDGSTSTKQTGRSITKYAWNFGDGIIQESNAPITTHTFLKGGSYNVQLQVTDSAGELSAPLTKAAVVPASSYVYLTAYPTNAGTGVFWRLGYSLNDEPHLIPGVPSVTSRSIRIGWGWRMKLNAGYYEGFKPDLSSQSLEYIASVRLLAMINNPVISDLFLVSYGLNHNEAGSLRVGRGWVEDMGNTPFRLTFTPDKTVAAQTISLIKNTYSYSASGGRNPRLQICGYYIGSPRANGICVGKGWINGIWRNNNPLVADNGTANTDTAQTTEAWRGATPYSVWISNWYYLSDAHNLFGYSTVEPAYNVPHSYSGKGYVEGNGMSLIYIPSGGG